VEVPTVKPDEIDPLSSGEVKKLLSVNDQWIPMFTLFVYTGLRRCEALGLTWDNVDLDSDSPTLKVAQTLASTRSNGTMGSIPKSIAGNREVPLSNSVFQVLRTHRTNQNELRLRLGKL
jgi:integrase